MITDEVSIYNLALNAVGTRSNISLPSEKSREAEVCRLWFGPVRDQVLRAAPWPSTKAWSRLAVLSQRTDDSAWVPGSPEPGYGFAYAPPQGMLAPRFLAGYQPFTLQTYPGNRMALMTNVEDALLCYSMSQQVIGLWDVGLQMAVVYGLAAYIAMPLHGKATRAKDAASQANDLITQARVESANTDVEMRESIPSWISERGYSRSFVDTRYFYPMGSLFSAGEIGV